MELHLAARAFELLLGWSLVLQSLEYLRIMGMDRISHWPAQRRELPARPAWLSAALDRLMQEGPYRAMLVLRLILALMLMAGWLNLVGSLLLFLIALALLFRWRGAFNGGSDFMTLVGLSGLLLAHLGQALGHGTLGWTAALWYVTLQTITSYFVSGWVKLLRPEWRSGAALPVFLDSGVYGPLPADSLFRRPWLARTVSWVFTVWEGCFVLALLDQRLAVVFCASALVFHFLVYRYFGLNRFFWAWLASFPAVIWCSLP
jgi:hypothetical protein